MLVRVRICFVCHSGSGTLGGAERCTAEAIGALRKRGFDCWAVVPARGALSDRLERDGVETAVVGYTWWASDDRSLWGRFKRLARNLAASLVLARLIRRRGCDLVYTSTITVCSGAAAAKLLGLPHVWHLYEFGVEDHGLYFDLGRAFSCGLISRWSVACVAVSRAIAAHYAPFIPAEKLKLVYFAVDPPEDDGAPVADGFNEAGALKCLLAGRLQENKGQQDAIRAVAELKSTGLRASLTLAGQGDAPDEARLKDLARSLGVDDRVRFIGQSRRVFALMRSADVVLMCSRQEALGRVSVEAMYAAKPVVGARGGGTPELIEDGVNGYLYEPGDAADLARALRAVAQKPEDAARMGLEGRRRALERFSRERLGTDLAAVVEPLVRQRGSGASSSG